MFQRNFRPCRNSGGIPDHRAVCLGNLSDNHQAIKITFVLCEPSLGVAQAQLCIEPPACLADPVYRIQAVAGDEQKLAPNESQTIGALEQIEA